MSTEKIMPFANSGTAFDPRQYTTFVFIVKKEEEFNRYPKKEQGYEEKEAEDGTKFRYRHISDTCNVFILDEFVEKKSFASSFSDPNLLDDFINKIIEYISPVLPDLPPEQDPENVVVLTHWGGGDDQSICKDERDLQENYQQNASDLSGWKFYSLSSLRRDLFDVEGNIAIGGENELRAMLVRFESMYQNVHYQPLIAFGIYLRGIVDKDEQAEIPYMNGIEAFKNNEACECDEAWRAYFDRKKGICITPDDARLLIRHISDLMQNYGGESCNV